MINYLLDMVANAIILVRRNSIPCIHPFLTCGEYFMRSSNPTLTNDTFTALRYAGTGSDVMTVNGTITRTLFLVLLCLLTAGYSWSVYAQAGAGANVSGLTSLTTIGAIGGFIVALVTVFKKEWAPLTAPLYALLQGLFIGGFSSIMEASFPGIVIQAAVLTFGTLFAMLAAYRSGLIAVTDKFRLGVVAATGGIALVYIGGFVLSFFGINMSIIYGNSWMGIVFSLFVVVVAALNFVIDFDFIDQGVANRVPKYMEWYGAFAIMVTLVWLYIEFLRLLSKLRSR